MKDISTDPPPPGVVMTEFAEGEFVKNEGGVGFPGLLLDLKGVA